MRKTKLVRALTFAATVLTASNALGSMILNKMIVYFQPNELPRQDVVVTNPDKQNLYLKTEIYKVNNPGTDKEETVRITDPSQMKLLTTPQKTIIKPGMRKTIRLVNVDMNNDEESVYRVTFLPVLPETKAKQNAIKLLVAYQALIFIRPRDADFTVDVKRKGDKVTFTNTGNANVVVRRPSICKVKNIKDDKNPCTELSQGQRIYAGQSFSVKLKGEGDELHYGIYDGRKDTPGVLAL